MLLSTDSGKAYCFCAGYVSLCITTVRSVISAECLHWEDFNATQWLTWDSSLQYHFPLKCGVLCNLTGKDR
jgi:hypothetical protein